MHNVIDENASEERLGYPESNDAANFSRLAGSDAPDKAIDGSPRL